MKKLSRLEWKMACAVGLLAWSGILTTEAQTFPQVAPNQPAPRLGSGQISTRLPEAERKRRHPAKSDVVWVNQLQGVFFVSKASEIRSGGVSSHLIVEPGDVAFAKRDDFTDVILPFIGQPVTMASLDKMTSAVVQYYRKHDRPIVNVFVPQQNITRGFIQIVVAEGHVGEVKAVGAKWFSNEDLRRELRLHPGDPISGAQLRQDLEWVNRNSFHQSDVVFGPGATPGATDITLKTEDRFPARFFAGLDDAGNQFTGDYRYFAGFNYGNLFGLDQQLSYQFTTAEDTNQFTAHSASYVIPLPWKHQLTIFGDYGQANANVPNTGGNVQSGGTNWQISFRYEVPLRGSPSLTHSLFAGFDFKRTNNDLALGGTTVSNNYADTDQFVAGYQASYTDPYGVTSGSLTGYFSPGGLSGDDNRTDYVSQRFDANPEYVYAQLNLQRVTKLPWNFTWTERGIVQVSDANLLPSEQLGLGGFDTVRGYDEREANGDSGFLISSEVMTPAISLGNLVGIKAASDQFQLLGFVDYGGTNLHTAGPSDTNPNTNLLGVGPGIRYNITPYMSFRFDYGFQLIKTGFDSRYDSRGHIGLVLSLPGGSDDHASSSGAEEGAGPSPEGKSMVSDDKSTGSDESEEEPAVDGAGFNAGIYGGLTAFQDQTSTLTAPNAPITPNSLNAREQSELGGVGGLRVGYTWKDFSDSCPWLMPALDANVFWAGYTYKAKATTTAFTGSYLDADLDSYSLMLEPKLKFRINSFHPYIGFGVGGTYLDADHAHVVLNDPGTPAADTDTQFHKTLQTGAFSVEGLAGLEYFLNQHWALNLEYKYQYIDLQGTIRSSIKGIPIHYSVDGLDSHFFTTGVSYYF